MTVELVRRAASPAVTIEPGPDWERAPDYAKSLSVAVARDRGIALRRRPGPPADRRRQARARPALIAAWPASWRTSAPGQLILGDLLAKQASWKQALGAYNRARAATRRWRPPSSAAASPCRRSTRTAPRPPPSPPRPRLDPTDPAAPGFRAYALLQPTHPEAVAAAQRAVGLDPRYADGFLPFGIGLLARRRQGRPASRRCAAGWCCWRSRTGRTR